MKRIIIFSFALIFCILLALPSSAAPIGGKCGEKAFWSYDTRTATLSICGTGTMYDYPFEAPWEDFKTEIRAVIVSGISNVGEFAFYGCENLKNIYLGYTVKSIDYYAFKECISLTNVYIPFGLKEIGWSAFENCTSLSGVGIPNTVVKIGDWAFAGCMGMKYVILPVSVKKIGNYAFNDVPCAIQYFGSVRQWSKVDTGYYNEWTNKVICFCW